jgi:hypothetical protein
LEFVCQERGPSCAIKAFVAIDKAHTFRMVQLPKAKQFGVMLRSFKRAAMELRDPVLVDDLPLEATMAFAIWVEEQGEAASDELVSWAAGLVLATRAIKRGGDLNRVRLENVSMRTEGGKWVFFPRTKNHPEGERVPVDAVPDGLVCPCRWLDLIMERRLEAGAGPSDWLFVKRNGTQADSGFWTRGVRAAVKLAQDRGLVEQGGRWSSKSLRNGGTAAMQRLGYADTAIQALGGWWSDAMRFYLRKTQLARDHLSSAMFSDAFVRRGTSDDDILERTIR